MYSFIRCSVMHKIINVGLGFNVSEVQNKNKSKLFGMNSRISVIGILKKCLDLGFPGNFQRSIRAIPLHFPTIPVNLNIQSPDSVQSTSNDRFLKSQETFQFTSCFKHTFFIPDEPDYNPVPILDLQRMNFD